MQDYGWLIAAAIIGYFIKMLYDKVLNNTIPAKLAVLETKVDGIIKRLDDGVENYITQKDVDIALLNHRETCGGGN